MVAKIAGRNSDTSQIDTPAVTIAIAGMVSAKVKSDLVGSGGPVKRMWWIGEMDYRCLVGENFSV